MNTAISALSGQYLDTRSFRYARNQRDAGIEHLQWEDRVKPLRPLSSVTNWIPVMASIPFGDGSVHARHHFKGLQPSLSTNRSHLIWGALRILLFATRMERQVADSATGSHTWNRVSPGVELT